MDDIWDDDAVEIARSAPKPIPHGGPSRSRVLSSDSEGGHNPSSSRPSKRARTDKPLFNPDSDDDDGHAPNKDDELPPGIDALFDGLDDDDFAMGLPPQLDTEKLQREADKRARTEAAKKRLLEGETDVLGERVGGEGDGKPGEKPIKTKRVIPKLDETRCV
jgi:hypothetical protein